MRILPATCYKCQNADRQGVSTQKRRSRLVSVATCSKIQKVGSFAGFVTDSCYKEIPINKGLAMCFQVVVATVASIISMFSNFLTLCFYLFNFQFLKISRRGDYLYINTACTQKNKKRKTKKRSGPLAYRSNCPQQIEIL